MSTDIAGLTYYEINLDSRNASSTADAAYSSLDFPMYELSGKVQLSRIAYMKVLSCSIPFSYYTINTTNNTFTLTDNSGIFIITLQPGTYSFAEMITEMGTKLNDSASTFTYTVTFRESDFSFSITNGSIPNLPFTFTFPTAANALAIVLGFAQGANPSQTFTVLGNKLTGGVSELLGPNFLYVNSNAIGNDFDMFLPRGSEQFGNGGPQMAVVPTDGIRGDDIHYKDPAPELWFDMRGMETLTRMDLFITDGGSHEILRFNGKAFTVKIGVLLANNTMKHGADKNSDAPIETKRRR